jgi:tetratricopeptide (TPR) repeat protein
MMVPAACPLLRLSAAALLIGLNTMSSQLDAQSDPRLVNALHIAQEGASDSARVLVTNLLNATPPTDSTYPQILYTMGLVSRSVDEMRKNYTRIAVEYANSPWADDALFRLALLDYAAGNYPGVIRQLDRIRNDYPDSPTLPAASEWGARSLFDLKREQEACSWLALGVQTAGQDIELKNRLDYLNGRCSGAPPVAAVGMDSATKPPAPPPVPAPAPAGSTPARTGFGVQVGAVNTQAAADKISRDLKGAGFTPYVVKEGGLFKVRAGPYADRPKAMTAAEQIRKKLGHSPFLVKEQ